MFDNDPSEVEYLAEFLASKFKAIEVKKDSEPIDICRFHRDIADDLLTYLKNNYYRYRNLHDNMGKSKVYY